jgi:predicted ArsR family transcriptional regulator
MPRAKSEFKVRTATQLRVLNAPKRMEIITALRESGPSTAIDLAARMDLRPEALHYHLRELERIGLVREVGRRATGRRPQTVFELVADRIRLPRTVATATFEREKARGCRLLLRRTERDVAKAFQSPARTPAAGSLRVTRDIVRLSATDRTTLKAKLGEIDAFLRERDRPGITQRLSVTIVVSPTG